MFLKLLWNTSVLYSQEHKATVAQTIEAEDCKGSTWNNSQLAFETKLVTSVQIFPSIDVLDSTLTTRSLQLTKHLHTLSWHFGHGLTCFPFPLRFRVVVACRFPLLTSCITIWSCTVAFLHSSNKLGNNWPCYTLPSSSCSKLICSHSMQQKKDDKQLAVTVTIVEIACHPTK